MFGAYSAPIPIAACKATSVGSEPVVTFSPPPSRVAEFQQALLAWFRRCGRHFPWRETRDPYRILTAEMLLQQTDAKKVLPVYCELLARFPTPGDLASAPSDEVEALIAPIGLKYRARRLQGAARVLVQAARPLDEAELMAIKGVGRYIARAVSCFAYGRAVGILDSNVIRILDRVFDVRSTRSRPHTDPALWEAVDRLVPFEFAREYNWALLDLSALLCRPNTPNCDPCPVAICRYRQRSRVQLAAEALEPYGER